MHKIKLEEKDNKKKFNQKNLTYSMETHNERATEKLRKTNVNEHGQHQ